MTRRSIPETVTNEVLLPQPGDTVYWLSLADEDVEQLAAGFCPERVAREAFTMLRWKREIYTVEAERNAKLLA